MAVAGGGCAHPVAPPDLAGVGSGDMVLGAGGDDAGGDDDAALALVPAGGVTLPCAGPGWESLRAASATVFERCAGLGAVLERLGRGVDTDVRAFHDAFGALGFEVQPDLHGCPSPSSLSAVLDEELSAPVPRRLATRSRSGPLRASSTRLPRASRSACASVRVDGGAVPTAGFVPHRVSDAGFSISVFLIRSEFSTVSSPDHSYPCSIMRSCAIRSASSAFAAHTRTGASWWSMTRRERRAVSRCATSRCFRGKGTAM